MGRLNRHRQWDGSEQPQGSAPMDPHADHLLLQKTAPPLIIILSPPGCSAEVQTGSRDRPRTAERATAERWRPSGPGGKSEFRPAGQTSSHIQFLPLSCRALECLPHREVTLAGRPGLLICQSVFSDPYNGF